MSNYFRQSAHSYFVSLQKTYEKQAFLQFGTVPQLQYDELSDAEIARRLELLPNDSDGYANLQIVKASHDMRRKPTRETVEAFRALNTALYGEPKKELAAGIIHYLTQTRHHNPEAKLWQYVAGRVGDLLETPISQIVAPSSELFSQMRQYMYEYIDVGALDAARTTHQALGTALELTGLEQQGWAVLSKPGFMHARTVHAKKHILVGAQYNPRRRLSKLEIAIHEVYGHALRGPQESLGEGEGFAILLEQLCNTSFKMKRGYRYLAAALGWGVSGKRMDFVEVYEIIWRLMRLYGRYSIIDARSHAFDEVSRVFRGGLPSEPGAVFLKDMVYFEANTAIWKRLEEHPLTYEAFVATLNGKEKILT